MKKVKRRKLKGFTLLELIIVISILAVLVAIAVPKYNNSREKSLITAHNSNVKVLEAAALNYYANEGKASNWPNDDSGKYLQEYPKVPKGLKGFESSGGEQYSVTISENGDITVSPAKISE